MKKGLIGLLTLVLIAASFATEKRSISTSSGFTDDSQICTAKDQSSAEALLKTIFACQNSQRAEEIIDLIFLGTDIHDQLLGISESDTLLIPNMLRDESISLKDWRARKMEEFTKMGEQDLKKITLLGVSKPSMHDQNPFQYHSDQTFDKALVRYAFRAIDKNAGDEEKTSPQSGRHLIIFMNGKAYLNQLPFDLWELDY